jgi:copper(I)-binding protein
MYKSWLVGMLAALSLSAGAAGTAAAMGTADSAVEIRDLWVRATGPGQPVAAAYGEIKASARLSLVGVTSPAAKRCEIHEMKTEGGMMRMRALKEVPLDGGKVVKLAPGGRHLMLFDLDKPLPAGTTVSITFTFRRKSGDTFTQTVSAAVRDSEPDHNLH